jgi:hypothetical protein
MNQHSTSAPDSLPADPGYASSCLPEDAAAFRRARAARAVVESKHGLLLSCRVNHVSSVCPVGSPPARKTNFSAPTPATATLHFRSRTPRYPLARCIAVNHPEARTIRECQEACKQNRDHAETFSTQRFPLEIRFLKIRLYLIDFTRERTRVGSP